MSFLHWGQWMSEVLQEEEAMSTKPAPKGTGDSFTYNQLDSLQSRQSQPPPRNYNYYFYFKRRFKRNNKMTEQIWKEKKICLIHLAREISIQGEWDGTGTLYRDFPELADSIGVTFLIMHKGLFINYVTPFWQFFNPLPPSKTFRNSNERLFLGIRDVIISANCELFKICFQIFR